MQHIDGDQERLACRCCGEKTDYDAYCLPCRHRYNEVCIRKVDNPKCGYCGFMLDVDGSCIRNKSHEQPARTS